MKNIKILAAAATLSLISCASFAQSITATGTTLDEAETQIAAQAKKAGASYYITEAHTGNKVHMTAKLTKSEGAAGTHR
ncbi:DUF1471 domain-containing protein [Serratia fonticola]|uniref:DUF1471 domain-containing protein n=1 Tax=Serratia fonticola TaxID=47917 RepID=UPI000E0F5446|nr:DUF1471 domain-containing protein [Serratia fonticola]RDL15177.1 uncharacterized protein DUF1471 [Serratia fonticola]